MKVLYIHINGYSAIVTFYRRYDGMWQKLWVTNTTIETRIKDKAILYTIQKHSNNFINQFVNEVYNVS